MVVPLVRAFIAMTLSVMAEGFFSKPVVTSPNVSPPMAVTIAHMTSVPPTDINPDFLAQVETCLMPLVEPYGYSLNIVSGFRSMEDQDELYEQGRVENGHIVTYKPRGLSIHNYGFAADVADRSNGYRINWERLGKLARYCGLSQGPEGDQAHFEYRGGLTIDQFAAGLRPTPFLVTQTCVE